MIELFFAVIQFVPVANVIDAVVGAVNSGAEPTWWKFGAQIVESIVVLQLIMPRLERFTRSTANTWDDGLVAKLKMVLAFSLEIIGALGAVDPQLGARIRAITGPREYHAPGTLG